MTNRFFVLALLAIVGCTQKEQVATLVLTNAKVYTVDATMPQAEAIAISGDTILFVGSAEAVKQYVGSGTEVVDCKGQFVMPGIIEGHGHIHGMGAMLAGLNLMRVKNWEEIVAKVDSAAKVAKPGEWIIGRGWHQEKWDHTPAKNFLGYPYHDELSRVSPNNPVILTHASGHASFLNAKAMELAGISAATPNPTGGDIVKDKNGTVLGVLEERAQVLVRTAYDEYRQGLSEAEKKRIWQREIALAEAECLRNGVTSFQDAGSSFEQVAWMKELAETGKLSIRHWVMVRETNAKLRSNASVFPIMGAGNNMLTVKAIKVSLDGALGSYGAWLLAPYSDRPGFYGQNTFNVDSLNQIAAFAWDKNLQLCVHAIGDRANRETIDIFSQQIQRDSTRNHRWRIEHAQHVHPSEIPRFAQWGILASMQGIHCTSDAPFVVKRLGEERARTGAYMWKAFLDAGVPVNNGTDVPVEDIDPFANFYASVTRKLKDGSAFYPEQRMTREQALYSYTMANAYAAFEEKQKGTLTKGKLADIVVLSNNLLTCADDAIPQTHSVMTVVGGKVKYKKQ